MEDRGSGNEGSETGCGPQSSNLDPAFMERLRWRCRRGLLELDIVLGHFIEQRYTQMDDAQQAAFNKLLDMPDTELWDMITGKVAPHEECRAVLELLQAA